MKNQLKIKYIQPYELDEIKIELSKLNLEMTDVQNFLFPDELKDKPIVGYFEGEWIVLKEPGV